jgi:2-(1,2-epoxy-1,2-dihydrophenyl)acetyl-CoA isomerase
MFRAEDVEVGGAIFEERREARGPCANRDRLGALLALHRKHKLERLATSQPHRFDGDALPGGARRVRKDRLTPAAARRVVAQEMRHHIRKFVRGCHTASVAVQLNARARIARAPRLRQYPGTNDEPVRLQMSDVLLEKRDDGVALITLNRPESLNAMGGELVPLLGRYLEECDRERSVRCVALTGAGRGFCAGGDVKGMQSRNDGIAQPEGGQPKNTITVLESLTRGLRESHNETTLKLHTMGKPTVALVNGVAVGAGLGLALGCDVRICSDRARFGTAFKNIGLSGDFGSSYLLPRLIGMGRAREMYFTAEIIDAPRALELGIANQVVPHDDLLPAGLAFAAKIAAGPTATYARMKQNLNFAETSTLQELLDQEALLMRMSGLSNDSREAVRAFIEKREPQFTGE